MQWYEVRARGMKAGHHNRFFRKDKAIEYARDFERRLGVRCTVYRVNHTEQEVTR